MNSSVFLVVQQWASSLILYCSQIIVCFPSRPTAAAVPSRHGFAKYSPDKYLPAVTNPTELDEILGDEGERERLQYCNVHPTPAYQTLSIFYHPRVM